MTEQIKNILSELDAIQAKLPELRELFWLKIDRYNEADQQRGVAFDEKFEQQLDKLFRVIDSFSTFIKNFAQTPEEIAQEKVQALIDKMPNWNDLPDDIKQETRKLLLDGIKQQDTQTPIKKGKTLHQTKNKKAPLSLKVIFPDGNEISENNAKQTFILSLEKIGIEKVAQLNLNSLVRTDTNFERSAKLTQIGNYYINTHSSTITKKRLLDVISFRLNLNLKVQI